MHLLIFVYEAFGENRNVMVGLVLGPEVAHDGVKVQTSSSQLPL